MAIGYNLLLPNGHVKKLRVEDEAERDEVVGKLLNKWQGYCESNWLSANGSDPYSPENKVKMFLSGLGYFLMVGDTEGIVTNYKEVMNGKREIPISSCPSYIDNIVYGGGATLANDKADEATRFASMLQKIDERAAPPSRTASPTKKKLGTDRGKRTAGIRSANQGCLFSFPVVDTTNHFRYGGRYFHIDNAVEAYKPKRTAEGLLYDMDHVVVVRTVGGQLLFYDMDYNPIDNAYVQEENF